MRSLTWLFMLCLASPSLAQSPVTYRISFENAAHHEAEVMATFSEVPAGPLEVRMSRTSPGRYALHEFAKNVYNVRAHDSGGSRLNVVRTNPHQWNISGHDGTVRVSYTLFGDRADGTYAGFDRTHAHMNIPATFMWALGFEDRPVEVTFEMSDASWRVASQLSPVPGRANTYSARDLAYFIDSPTEISAFDLREWTVMSGPRSANIRLAVHHAGTTAEMDAYTNMVKAVVREQQAVYGELPAYDHGEYTFIADYLPHVNGDGMEHRNSTILASTGSLEQDPIGLLGTVSHEFFHCWNVERIRPRTLEPFNLEGANMSAELWFAEGFTSYYDDLTMKRAGILSLDRYASGLSRTLNSVLTAPGLKFAGPAAMSQNATFVDAGVSIDIRNFQNTFVSYYSYGAVTGLALDLTIRNRFPALTLDDFMRAVWLKHGVTEIPYDNNDLAVVLGEVTGDTDFAQSFFARHIFSNETADYKSLLSQGGFLYRTAHSDSAWIGQQYFRFTDSTAVLDFATKIGSPLYVAGLDRGDVIRSIDGVQVASQEDLSSLIADHRPGDTLHIEYTSRGVDGTTALIVGEVPRIEVVPYEHAGLEVTSEMSAFRDRWLSSRVQGAPIVLEKYCHTCSRTYPFENDHCQYDGAALNVVAPER